MTTPSFDPSAVTADALLAQYPRLGLFAAEDIVAWRDANGVFPDASTLIGFGVDADLAATLGAAATDGVEMPAAAPAVKPSGDVWFFDEPDPPPSPPSTPEPAPEPERKAYTQPEPAPEPQREPEPDEDDPARFVESLPESSPDPLARFRIKRPASAPPPARPPSPLPPPLPASVASPVASPPASPPASSPVASSPGSSPALTAAHAISEPSLPAIEAAPRARAERMSLPPERSTKRAPERRTRLLSIVIGVLIVSNVLSFVAMGLLVKDARHAREPVAALSAEMKGMRVERSGMRTRLDGAQSKLEETRAMMDDARARLDKHEEVLERTVEAVEATAQRQRVMERETKARDARADRELYALKSRVNGVEKRVERVYSLTEALQVIDRAQGER